MKTAFYLILLFAFFTSCTSSLKKPEFLRVENVHRYKIGLAESTITMDLVFFNPNKSKLKFKWAKGDIWIEGDSVGHFILDSSSAIPSNAEFKLPARLILDTKKMLKATPVLLTSKEVMIRINGIARVGKSLIFVKYPLEYEGLQDLSKWLK